MANKYQLSLQSSVDDILKNPGKVLAKIAREYGSSNKDLCQQIEEVIDYLKDDMESRPDKKVPMEGYIGYYMHKPVFAMTMEEYNENRLIYATCYVLLNDHPDLPLIKGTSGKIVAQYVGPGHYRKVPEHGLAQDQSQDKKMFAELKSEDYKIWIYF